MSAIQTFNHSIVLSIAEANAKQTTSGYRVVEVYSLYELMELMNRYAVAAGLFMNGYRHSRNFRSSGNLLLIDIDTAELQNDMLYYEYIEQKLRENKVSFVSVPSQSANVNPYKRHIAIILDHPLPTDTQAYREGVEFILQSLNIDIKKVDKSVLRNAVSNFAPAAINKKFENYADLSYVFEAQAYNVPTAYRVQKKITHNNEGISTNQLIHFSDGSINSVYDAKKIMIPGSKKLCYCPNSEHVDKNPSATFYYNPDKSVHIHCGKCGNVKISRYFFPSKPKIDHQNNKYHIAIEKREETNILDVFQILGTPSYENSELAIWYFSVNSISDIYSIFLAKAYLLNKDYRLVNILTHFENCHVYSVIKLNELIVNQTLPSIYINPTKQLGPYEYVYFWMKSYIYRHSYFFVEAAIFTIFQNVIDRERTYEETCNLGLAYFDYIIRTQEEDIHKKQKDKRFPVKLTDKQRIKSDVVRLKNKARTDKRKMTARQRKIQKLIKNDKFRKPNGNINKAALAKFLQISRQQLYTDLRTLVY